MRISHDFEVERNQGQACLFADVPRRWTLPKICIPSRPGSKHSISVWPEYTSFIGDGRCPPDAMPPDPVMVAIREFPSPEIHVLTPSGVDATGSCERIVMAISRGACRRLFGHIPEPDQRWHLTSALRSLANRLANVNGQNEASDLLRAALSIELLSTLFADMNAGQLVRKHAATSLREAEIARIVEARRLVDESSHEPLTVHKIARSCGLSRGKLVAGFRDLYQSTVFEAIVERRLSRAKTMLLQTDLRISTIGYQCGYSNNAAFTRAFSRRFDATPSQIRRAAEKDAVNRPLPCRRADDRVQKLSATC